MDLVQTCDLCILPTSRPAKEYLNTYSLNYVRICNKCLKSKKHGVTIVPTPVNPISGTEYVTTEEDNE